MDEEKEIKKAGKRRGLVPGLILGFLIGILAAVILAAAALVALRGVGLDYPGLFRKMVTIDNLIDEYYLYDADPGDISEGIFAGMLYGLTEDGYAEYYTPSVHEEVERHAAGSYVGIGITVVKDEDTGGIRVEAVSEGGPADSAGIRKGDIIISADGVDLTETDLDTAVSHISGEEGSPVEIVYLRDGVEVTVTVTRETIVTNVSVHSKVFRASEIEGARLGSLKVGYISISEFIQTTEADFTEAYDNLVEDEEVDGLIIDLRNNPGGDMNVCVNMLSLIISADAEVVLESPTPYEEGDLDGADGEDGALILAVENKAGERTLYRAAVNLKDPRCRIIVLVNGRSASASEIFAGALRDYGFTILGTKTYGKGIVQSVISLTDGSAVKFTTDQYRLPGGGYVQGVGVEPTEEVKFEEFDGVTEGSVNYASGEEEPDMLKDSQIRAAVDIIENEAYELYQETA